MSQFPESLLPCYLLFSYRGKYVMRVIKKKLSADNSHVVLYTLGVSRMSRFLSMFLCAFHIYVTNFEISLFFWYCVFECTDAYCHYKIE